MKHLDEYRDPQRVRALAAEIHRITTRPHCLMEVCGGQTHAIVRHGLDSLLPPLIELIHGPGCPVCVTDTTLLDAAIAIARQPGVILCSFGDMLRVPGSQGSLLSARAEGADVRMLYSPLDAVALATAHPERQVVFFAVGFETTAPANATAALRAHRQGLTNFSLLVGHVRVPPAIRAILREPDNRVQGFLAAGHVCAVMGLSEYQPLADEFQVPIVVTGFEPVDILEGILCCVKQREAGEARLENVYARAVRADGNLQAQVWMTEVFEVVPRAWRGMGELPGSGLGLRGPYQAYDALRRFAHCLPDAVAGTSICRAGEVLTGRLKPSGCPAFGGRCTPDHPLGAPMVSSEGACAAYYRYRSPA